ncbi:MAG: glycosyltransferase family 2 protein [Armatimonadota bacterium]
MLTLSIITPSYNQAQYIERTIASVLGQDYPYVEYVVVDGGSQDGTQDILRRYPQVRWVSEPDRGQADAVNKGIRMTTGEVIGWINSDDTYAPGAFTLAVRVLEANPHIAMVYGDMNVIGPDDELLLTRRSRPFSLRRLILTGASYIFQPTVFMRRRALYQVGLLDVGLRHAMDYDLWIRLGRRFPALYIPKVLANFRLHPRSKTATEMALQRSESKALRRRYITGAFDRLCCAYYDLRVFLYQHWERYHTSRVHGTS